MHRQKYHTMRSDIKLVLYLILISLLQNEIPDAADSNRNHNESNYELVELKNVSRDSRF